MKNYIQFKLLRMNADYDVNIYTFMGKIFLRNLNAEKIVAFAGINPVIKESGKQRSIRVSKHSSNNEVHYFPL